jgi:hypothetical protein
LPTAIAKLTLNVQEVEAYTSNDGSATSIDIGKWFLVNNELIQAPDPRVNHLSEKYQLSAESFLTALLDSTRGATLSREEWEEEKLEDIYALSDLPTRVF